MGIGPKWTEFEIKYLFDNYSNTSNESLAKELNRSIKGVSYQLWKYKLKKDKEFFCKSRKKLNFDITKEAMLKSYFDENKSMRKIAKELNVGKTTIEYYFKKYKIQRRNKSEATKLRFTRESTWTKGKLKTTDSRIARMAEKVKQTYIQKRLERFRKIEEKFGKSFRDIINDLYWKENLTQEKIAIKLNISKKFIVDLMKEHNIPKRPNFEYIASLKGEKHPLFGTTWENLFGLEKTTVKKKEYSDRFRKLIIKRLQNKEMPFFYTKIEIMMADELNKRNIIFETQYPIDEKFVCDLAIPTYKIAIECDGDYWHANPKFYDHNKLDKSQIKKIQTDKFKEKYLIKKGWKLFRFYEADIKANIKGCVDEIEYEIKKVRSPMDNLNNK